MTKHKDYQAADVLAMVADYLPEEQVQAVKKAYDWAAFLHKEQKRQSGIPYIAHPIQVAGILAELKMDGPTIIAGFLHDIVEDTPVSLEDVVDRFGPIVGRIVDGVTKISKIKYQDSKVQLAENHRKLLLAMAKDIRVIIVKLADRLHNMRTLDALRPEKQRRISQETLSIYAPLADRLGISAIKWELEDLSLSYLEPDAYHKIASMMSMKRDERLAVIQEAIDEIEASIDELHIKDVSVYGRPKHIYSIYRKLVDQHKSFDEIYDLSAIRVLTENLTDTYAVLGAIHAHWKPLPGRFKDYIALPKPNGYQSLHTTVIGPAGRPLEVQIRTYAMHQVAEFGVAAHWAYKKNKGSDQQADVSDKSERVLNMIQGILEFQESAEDAQDFMDSVQTDLFVDRVYAFSPAGDVYELSKGAGPLDMAFAIHSKVGAHTTGAKANGRIVPLDYQIQNGDIMEILTSPNAQPSRDWLDLVKTRKARHKIKSALKKRDREENIQAGLDAVSKELFDQGYDLSDFVTDEKLQGVADVFQSGTKDDLLAAVGYGDVTRLAVVRELTKADREAKEAAAAEELQKRLLEEGGAIKKNSQTNKKKEKADSDVVIAGIDSLLVHLAKCCTPVPGDNVTGYITQGRGVAVHRFDCPNIHAAQKAGERLVDVIWADPNGQRPDYTADLTIHAENEPGILNSLLKSLNAKTRFIKEINGHVTRGGMVQVQASLGVMNLAQLNGIIDSLSAQRSVYEVKRTIH
ncbi:bifunctional (p)ppGpp synthetase/guanosine-3',5'-bis(diphosphate) 3'-pyrophosphohydrolase [Fructobacillus sp. M1-13]|uniref:GTP diphosphokinase n=1 Tax=Fructobacillus papyriferae TaxID=2713171 RepID=A0ABS5QQB1_9LACO|nr:bifunctional (p)ppGpp synthetase/guanosine-3',5'-bis(diphosphate) 3'-pyrophosphohydrolase [Fructobacillus papyriferae]MBS9334591.1 bifunctional (p)ppGpp synthetase/guanosine-3',5'-bis(diphosphate) 3'-pyrophosphohydrolase [Fructobacillus papyriferae]MCD2158580.1 bifunctional (p)ppGpp synthetase/guanosine-3',5'-bis(diphosphate) 3'-pyrophosphohydrolase [Fructobacillus papyriferae]